MVVRPSRKDENRKTLQIPKEIKRKQKGAPNLEDRMCTERPVEKRRPGRPRKNLGQQSADDIRHVERQTESNKDPTIQKRKSVRPRKNEQEIQRKEEQKDSYQTNGYNFRNKIRRPRW